MEPLRITFHLSTPMVAPAYPIHLDALVAFAVTEQRLADPDTPKDCLLRDLAEQLPLARHEHPQGWVWQASALIPSDVGEQSIRAWTRRTNTDDLSERIGRKEIEIGARSHNALFGDSPRQNAMKLDTQRGLLKNMLQFYPTVEIRKLEAWCIGDIDQLGYLLDPGTGLISHLGKRGRIGHGQIISVDIDGDETAHEQWKKRVLPWRESADYVSVQAAARPPYWSPENRQNTFMPVTL